MFICIISITKASKGSLKVDTTCTPYTNKQVIVRYRVAVTDDAADTYKNHYCLNLDLSMYKITLIPINHLAPEFYI